VIMSDASTINTSPPMLPLHKKNTLTRAVLSNWAGYAVMVVTGFVMPRLISDELGQKMLGLWDFAWALVSYTELLRLGIVGAASRYVARFAELNDWTSLNRIVSTCAMLLLCSFLVACGLIAVLVILTPALIKENDPLIVDYARQLVVLMGLSAALQLPLALYQGVLTGFQRFDLKNAIRGIIQLAGLIAMIWLVTHGYGLASLAIAILAIEVGCALVYMVVSHRIFKPLRIAPSLITRKSIANVLGFGGKSVMRDLARSSLYQASALIVSAFLGLSALGVYARQRSLVMSVQRILAQFGNVFAPTASALHAKNDVTALRSLLIKSGRYGYFLALPFVAILTISGGPLVRVWMRDPAYEVPLVLAIFALGHLVSLAHRGVFMILVGMNRHGWSALSEMIVALASIPLGLVFVGVFKWGLVGAALAVALPVAVGGGLAPAYFACRALNVPMDRYFRRVLGMPLLAVSPLVVCLLVARLLLPGEPFWQLVAGAGAGGALLIPVYWWMVVPASLKNSLTRRLRHRNPPTTQTKNQTVASAVREGLMP